MKAHTSLLAITILVAIVTITIPLAYAQGFFDEEACPDCEGMDIYTKENLAAQNTVPILVWTDKSVYDHKATITVEGSVAAIRTGAAVGLMVIGPPPFNNVITIDQVPVGSDGKFRTTLNTKGDLWKYDGTYTIKVTYGTQEVFDKTEVELTGGILAVETVRCDANELAASGQCIPYDISGATVTSAMINVGTTSLIVNIDAMDDGMITLEIPRKVLDTDSTFDPFFVLVDGEEVDADESATSTKRTVTVMFPAGAEEIEIIGTFAIPEFGTIATLILVVAIISIIAISAKTRLKVLPKY